MPTGIYKRSKKWRENHSKAMKGNKNLLGHKHTLETRKKMSEAGKKRRHSKATREKMSKSAKGLNSWSKGKKHSLEAIKKISEAKKGKKHPNWKGGITPENARVRRSIEYRLWREAVFARDNWTCQRCRDKEERLCSHHIQNFAQFPELRFAIDNGITFCRKCHRKFHKKYGTENNTKKQLREFLSN